MSCEARYVDSFTIFQLFFNMLASRRAGKHSKYARDKHQVTGRDTYLQIQVREVNKQFFAS